MKTSTLEKMKFLVFKNSMKFNKYEAIGILEGIWYLTATSARDGAIGRFSDTEIGAWLEYTGNPTELVSSLVESGFLDRCQAHRLVVHHWEDHCPNHIKGNMAKHGQTFAKVTKPALPSSVPSKVPGTVQVQGPMEPPSYSILSNSILSNPIEREVDKKPKRQNFKPPTLPEVRQYCEEISSTINPATFFNHYETVGWRVGKNKMKDWRAAVRGWNSRDKGRGNQL